MEKNSVLGLEFSTPRASDPVETCPFCEFIFRERDDLIFHMVEVHSHKCSAKTNEEYRRLSLIESNKLFIYHLKICSLIMLTMMALAYIYAFALVG
tara:strand:- start:1167 stop:1454 length:288 start_codon:yes stop_codon:yes gene_type:complete